MPYSVDRYRDNQFSGQSGWPLQINDGNIVSTATSLKILGRGVPNYGEFIAENFIHLLENFSGVQAPDNPITGQLWYETDPRDPIREGLNSLKIFNGTQFVSVSSATRGSSFPANPIQGQTHLLSSDNRMYIYSDNVRNWVPVYSFLYSSTEPTNPQRGDIFYNTTTEELKIRANKGSDFWLDILTVNDINQAQGQNANIGVSEGYFLFKSLKNNIEADGSNISSATVLNNNINVITTIPSLNDNGVKFTEQAPIGTELTVINRTNLDLKVYPHMGGKIDDLDTNGAFILGPQAKAVFIKISLTEYVTMTAIYG